MPTTVSDDWQSGNLTQRSCGAYFLVLSLLVTLLRYAVQKRQKTPVLDTSFRDHVAWGLALGAKKPRDPRSRYNHRRGTRRRRWQSSGSYAIARRGLGRQSGPHDDDADGHDYAQLRAQSQCRTGLGCPTRAMMHTSRVTRACILALWLMKGMDGVAEIHTFFIVGVILLGAMNPYGGEGPRGQSMLDSHEGCDDDFDLPSSDDDGPPPADGGANSDVSTADEQNGTEVASYDVHLSESALGKWRAAEKFAGVRKPGTRRANTNTTTNEAPPTTDDLVNFVPRKTHTGTVPGFVFKKDGDKIGYHRDFGLPVAGTMLGKTGCDDGLVERERRQ